MDNENKQGPLNSDTNILVVNGEPVRLKTKEEREAEKAAAKAELDARLARGEIDGAKYNEELLNIMVPPEYKPKPRRKVNLWLIITLFTVLIVASIPTAIYLNWIYYFQNTLSTEGLPDYSEDFSSSLESGPIQINLGTYADENTESSEDEVESEDIIEYTRAGEYKGRPIKMTFKAYYDMTGKIVSIRDYWGFDDYDALAPRDICVVWGKLADRYPSPDMSFHHGTRMCEYSLDGEAAKYLDLAGRGAWNTTHLGSSLVANNHLIPGTAEVRNDILHLKINDVARIVGYLVEVDYGSGFHASSSMTRDDVMFDHTSTTCEIFYVTKVQVLSQDSNKK